MFLLTGEADVGHVTPSSSSGLVAGCGWSTAGQGSTTALPQAQAKKARSSGTATLPPDTATLPPDLALHMKTCSSTVCAQCKYPKNHAHGMAACPTTFECADEGDRDYVPVPE